MGSTIVECEIKKWGRRFGWAYREVLEADRIWITATAPPAFPTAMAVKMKCGITLTLFVLTASLCPPSSAAADHSSSDAAADFVKKTISSHKIAIFSKSYCPYVSPLLSSLSLLFSSLFCLISTSCSCISFCDSHVMLLFSRLFWI